MIYIDVPIKLDLLKVFSISPLNIILGNTFFWGAISGKSTVTQPWKTNLEIKFTTLIGIPNQY